MNNRGFILYSFFTTILGIFLFFLFAQSSQLSISSTDTQILGSKAGYALATMLLTLLIYRAILATLKIKVEKLAVWHTKKEKVEDLSFIRIIEALVGVLAVSLTVTICAINLTLSSYGVVSQYLSVKDLMLSFIASFVVALLSYYFPKVLETEYFLLSKRSTK